MKHTEDNTQGSAYPFKASMWNKVKTYVIIFLGCMAFVQWINLSSLENDYAKLKEQTTLLREDYRGLQNSYEVMSRNIPTECYTKEDIETFKQLIK